jgi:hypothetical protein
MPLWDRNMLTDAPIQLCPIRAVQLAPEDLRAEVMRMQFELYPLFEKGYLLVKGGIADQPARYISYMQEIGELVAQIKYKLTAEAQEREHMKLAAASSSTMREQEE